MGKKWNIENIECYGDSYQIDIRDEDSGKGERLFIRRDAFFALLTVAEKRRIVTTNVQPLEEK